MHCFRLDVLMLVALVKEMCMTCSAYVLLTFRFQADLYVAQLVTNFCAGFPGGAAGPGPCMRPPPAPPPPPGFERWWAGDMAPTAPPFFPPGANGAPFSSVSARFRKTRRYTNVVCCPDMLTANVSPRTRGPWHGMLPPLKCEPYEGLFMTDRGDKGLTTDLSRSLQCKICEATVPRICMRTHVGQHLLRKEYVKGQGPLSGSPSISSFNPQL